MKKIIFGLFLCLVSVFALASCGKKEAELSAVMKQAKNYVLDMYRNSKEATPNDYNLIGVAIMGDESLPITWTLTVTSGNAEDVSVAKNEETGLWTVDVNEKAAADVVYVLKATITRGDETVEVEFNHKLPKFEEATWEDYVAAEKGSTVTVKGVITAILSKTNGNSVNGLYVQDESNKGAYYVYGFNQDKDPVTEELLLGQTVRITGEKDNYNGTLEIKDASYELLDSTVKTVAPVDYTEKYTAAANLKDENLVAAQGLLVTIKGVTVTDQNKDSGYYKFKLGELESYVRISSSVCPMVKADQTEFINGHTEHTNWIADVTGIINVYNGSFYLSPASKDAFVYKSLPVIADDAAVATVKKSLEISQTDFTKAGEIELPAKGYGEQVSITWAITSELAKVENGKLVVTAMPDATQELDLVATLTAGEATDTKTIKIKLIADKSFIAEAKKVAEGLEHNTTTEDEYLLVGTVTKITTEYNSQYGNVSFNLSDGILEILIYRYDLEDAATIKVGDYLAFTAKLKKYNTTLEAVSKFTKFNLTTLDKAAELGLGDDADAKKNITVYGVVEAINTAYDQANNRITVTLKEGSNSLQCYRLSGGSDISVGDYLLVKGDASSYNNKAQMAAGASYVKSGKVIKEEEEDDSNYTSLIKALFAASGDDVATVGHSEDNKTNTWTKGDLTVVAEGSTAYDGNAHIRWYKDGTIEITFNQDFIQLSFVSTSDKKPAGAVITPLTEGVTIEVKISSTDSTKFTITLSAPVKTIKLSTNQQIRLQSLEVMGLAEAE